MCTVPITSCGISIRFDEVSLNQSRNSRATFGIPSNTSRGALSSVSIGALAKAPFPLSMISKVRSISLVAKGATFAIVLYVFVDRYIISLIVNRILENAF